MSSHKYLLDFIGMFFWYIKPFNQNNFFAFLVLAIYSTSYG